MDIKWNTVTWYSKLLAVIFFIGIFPALTFYLGREYQRTLEYISYVQIPESRNQITHAQSSYSGIRGTALTNTVISISSVDMSVETTSDPNGNFVVFLPPGLYTVQNELYEAEVIVEDGLMTTLALHSSTQ